MTAGRSAGTEQGQGRECDWDCALTGHAHCTTMGCDIPGTVWGLFDDGDTRQRVLYCSECARDLTESGEFVSSPSVPPARYSGRDEAREAAVDAIAQHMSADYDSQRAWVKGDDTYRESWRDEARELLSLPAVAALLRDGTTT